MVREEVHDEAETDDAKGQRYQVQDNQLRGLDDKIAVPQLLTLKRQHAEYYLQSQRGHHKEEHAQKDHIVKPADIV